MECSDGRPADLLIANTHTQWLINCQHKAFHDKVDQLCADHLLPELLMFDKGMNFLPASEMSAKNESVHTYSATGSLSSEDTVSPTTGIYQR